MESTEKQSISHDVNNKLPLQIAQEAALALFRKKGTDIRLYHVEEITVIADYYVICTARVSTHAKALVDEVCERLQRCEVTPQRVEGRNGGEWLLVDVGTVLVHIFTKDAREYYHLERLLSPQGEVDLTDLFERAGEEEL